MDLGGAFGGAIGGGLADLPGIFWLKSTAGKSGSESLSSRTGGPVVASVRAGCGFFESLSMSIKSDSAVSVLPICIIILIVNWAIWSCAIRCSIAALSWAVLFNNVTIELTDEVKSLIDLDCAFERSCLCFCFANRAFDFFFPVGMLLPSMPVTVASI